MTTEKLALIRDPAAQFRDPDELLQHTGLSESEKLEALESWQADLIELQTATEENMPASDEAFGKTATKLAKVRNAIRALQEREARA